MARKSDYHRMTVAEKEAHNRQHAPPTRCPHCDIALQAEDLIGHVRSRCPGKPQIHPRSRWVNHRQAIRMGVSKAKLHRLTEKGKVRTSGERGQRRYLLVDLAKAIAIDEERRERREGKAEAKPAGKTLTKPRRSRQSRRMGVEIKTKPLPERIAAAVEKAGSYAAASRTLDVPVDSLRKAAKGEAIRRGTQILIERQLDEAGE